MLLQKEPNHNSINIKSYKAGEINISGTLYNRPILLQPSNVTIFESATNFSALNIDQLIERIPSETEVLLIGTGEKHLFLPQSAIQQINRLGLSVEVMATRPACHTFQILAYENRKVFALLFI